MLTLMPTEIEFAHRPFPDRPSIKAVVSFRYGHLKIRGARVIERPGGAIRLGMPSSPIGRPCPACSYVTGVADLFCAGCGRNLSGRRPGRGREPIRGDLVEIPDEDARRAIEHALLDAWYDAAGPMARAAVVA